MGEKLLKGKPIAEKNMRYCLEKIEVSGLSPHLYVFIIGNDPASEYYVNSIKKQGQKINIRVTIQKFFPEEISEENLIENIKSLNKNPDINGIMVQKPLPIHIDAGKIEQIISPEKDMDGFHAINAGLLIQEKECILPCTAQAIIEMMDFYNISAEGKHVVVVGRSNVVGKPIANLLLYKQKNRNATVTICHSRTPDLSKFTRQADILVTAVGVANLIDASMIKDNVIILDAGINEIKKTGEKTVYVGDVNFDSCFDKCQFISPVPGGIGSITTSILFKHLCDCSKKR
ncbi:MAG: bifunctional 5,10-methylenetetrahydrofolate dehydrogenase/5,10-methenyltetrahydrofolate cyclohydrolase [Candidatus Cloacimonetes bacterium]|nr:bifunctional 5,10-methylenetetrahydrofolate dehydrogenase/5,10-methenyltetrahydrofolate cyclohydrolase [Candidatus Cloacimonadota bacterium]